MHAARTRTYWQSSGALALACLLSMAAPALAGAAPGDLDPTFSGNGLLTSDLGRGHSRAAGLALQADGKIVAAGRRSDTFFGDGSQPDFAVTRYSADGFPDSTFSGDGWLTTDFSPDGDEATAVAVQPSDGKIVVVGHAGGAHPDFAIARYAVDGTPDTTFSGDGRLQIDFGADSKAAGVAVQPDGAIVVAGTAGVDAVADFALARVTAAGVLDTSFHGDGRLTTNIEMSDGAAAVALAPGGAIVVAGTAGMVSNSTEGDFAVARYTSAGMLDTSFDGDGIQTVGFPYGGRAAALALQADDQIVVTGTMYLLFAFVATVRLSAGGVLDSSFSGDGYAITEGGYGAGVAVSPADGAITVLASDTQSFTSMLVRYDSAGTPDATWSAYGTRVVREIANPAGLVRRPDGRLVCAGGAGGEQTSNDFVVTRHHDDGTLDASFADGDGVQTTEFPGAGIDEAAAVAVRAGGGIVAVGDSDLDGGPSPRGIGDLVIADFDGAGVPNAAFSGDGVVTDDRLRGATGAVLQDDGAIVVVGHSDGDFGVVRYGDDGTRDAGFGSDGLQRSNFGGAGDRATAVALDADGRIVVAGTGSLGGMSGSDVAVARYDVDGAPDASFSGDGILMTDFDGFETVGAVAVAPDGKIVVAGGVSGDDPGDFAVARYDSDGELDTSFSGDGRQTIDFGGVDTGEAVAVLADGRIVVAGAAHADGDDGGDFAIARLNVDGSLDTTFAGDGSKTTDFRGDDDIATGVMLAPGGAIVVAGIGGGDDDDFALARYLEAGALDTSFSGDGLQLTDFADGDDDALAIAAVRGGKLVAAGSATITTSPDFALARYDNGQAAAVTPPPTASPPPAPPADTLPPPADTVPPPAPPPPPALPAGPEPDRSAPAATLSARASQRLGATVVAGVTCHDEGCVATVGATVRIAAAGSARAVTRTLREIRRPIAAGTKGKFELRLSRTLRATIRRALRLGRAVTVTVRATVADAAGNKAVPAATRVRLRG